MKNIVMLTVVLSVIAITGCSSTPKVRKITPVTSLGTYEYGQAPEQRQLKYRGPEYKEHLRTMQRMGMQHEERLAAEEYQVKEAIADVRLRKQAETNGVVFPKPVPAPAPQSYNYQQRQWGATPTQPANWGPTSTYVPAPVYSQPPQPTYVAVYPQAVVRPAVTYYPDYSYQYYSSSPYYYGSWSYGSRGYWGGGYRTVYRGGSHFGYSNAGYRGGNYSGNYHRSPGSNYGGNYHSSPVGSRGGPIGGSYRNGGGSQNGRGGGNHGGGGRR